MINREGYVERKVIRQQEMEAEWALLGLYRCAALWKRRRIRLFRQVGAVLLAPHPIIGGRYEEPITLWAMVSRKSRFQDSRLECHWSTDRTLHSAGLELIQLLSSAMQLDILFLRYWRPSRCARQPNDRVVSCGRAAGILPDHGRIIASGMWNARDEGCAFRCARRRSSSCAGTSRKCTSLRAPSCFARARKSSRSSRAQNP